VTSTAPNETPPEESLPSLKKRRLPRAVRWLIRGLLVLVLTTVSFFVASEIGTRVAVNGSADPDAGDIHVYLVSNGVHVDVWVPAQRQERDWVSWLPTEVPLRSHGYVAFGWGDREFFLEVPTWDDLTVAVALRGALLPTRSAMHVLAFSGPPRVGDRVHRLSITAQQYADLVAFIDSGFRLDADGRPVLLDHPGYQSNDRFFDGSSRYHLLNTCNVWTNSAVKAMGQKAALWAPFERSARFHLPRNRGSR
jgi:uncharacterized protein (TIGR02117 family)